MTQWSVKWSTERAYAGHIWAKRGPEKVENRGFIRGIEVNEDQIAFYEVEGVRLFPGIMIL